MAAADSVKRLASGYPIGKRGPFTPSYAKGGGSFLYFLGDGINHGENPQSLGGYGGGGDPALGEFWGDGGYGGGGGAKDSGGGVPLLATGLLGNLC